MFTGIDIGGTNTDVAVIDGDIRAVKVSNKQGFEAALSEVRGRGRLAVSTSQPLNRLLAGNPPGVHAVTVPGPGLICEGGIAGAVNHRGDIVEHINQGEVSDTIKRNMNDAIAITCKFSIRNPAIEEEIATIASLYYPPERIAVSHHIGRMNFPARAATTIINAQLKETVTSISRMIGQHHPRFLFVKSDGGLAPPSIVIENPALLYHSSSAAVAMGALFLTKEQSCLVVDIGGTTTDLVPLQDGKPQMSTVEIEGKNTLIESVQSTSLPYGGDSVINGQLMPRRIGDALAFGGPAPVLTDALNCCGCEIGEYRRSHAIGKETANEAVKQYIHEVVRAVRIFQPEKIIGTGYLAPYLIPKIAEEAGVRFIIPEMAGCANAIGVAVSRISLILYARFDSGRRTVVYNGETRRLEKMGDDDAVISACMEEARARAVAAGAPAADVRDISLLYFNAFDVIRSGRRAERIADVAVQIAPGITVEAL